jgi:hypothetical protein
MDLWWRRDLLHWLSPVTVDARDYSREGLNLSPTRATNGHGFQLGEIAMSSNLSRNITSRKVLLSLAAATVAVTSLASSPSYARGFGAGHPFIGGGRTFMGGGRTFMAARNPGGSLSLPPIGRHSGVLGRIHPRPPGHPIIPAHLKSGRLIDPIPILYPPHHHHHHHHHHHWVFRDGHWIVVDVDDDIVGGDAVSVDPGVGSVSEAPVVAPCNCLTKTYTPTGLVVFADSCTKESASAPALSDHADAAQAPTTEVPAKATPMSEVPTAPNYAGRTYEDYLAANPQAAPAAALQPGQ